MSNFLISVVASLAAGILLLLATSVISSRARWVLTGILGRLLDVDVDAVFTDNRMAGADLRQELQRARNVAIITGRGNEFQRETFDPLFLHRPATKMIHVRILLPKTE